MEAIEVAMAEPGRSRVTAFMATGRDVLDGAERPEAILDFCPLLNSAIDVDAPLMCVEAELVGAHGVTRTVVPAAQVFFPDSGAPTPWFLSSTNGLASGNTVAEASLHALLEVIERDIRSFNSVRDVGIVVDPATMPEAIQDIFQRTSSAGLDICVRTVLNEFGLPFFEAAIWDRYARSMRYLNGGWGCHLFREIALVRAVSEAIQSRLSWIHGGRDDLEEWVQLLGNGSIAVRQAHQTLAETLRSTSTVDFRLTPTTDSEFASAVEAFDFMIERLAAKGFTRVCRVVFTEAHDSLQVVRIIVPRLEFFDTRQCQRVGPRLHDVLKQLA